MNQYKINTVDQVISRYAKRYNLDQLQPEYVGEYVIHDHKATNQHFDLRLEFPKAQKSVLRSWALPKHTIPKQIGDKVLAIETEDHSMSYGDIVGFDGVYGIPEGYGAGTVTLYDKGTFTIIDMSYDHKYVMRFEGTKLNGVWSLVKMEGKEFLFIKSGSQE